MRSARPSTSLAKRTKLLDKFNRSKKSLGFLRGQQRTEFFKAARPPLASGTIRGHDHRLLLGDLSLMLFVQDRAVTGSSPGVLVAHQLGVIDFLFYPHLKFAISVVVRHWQMSVCWPPGMIKSGLSESAEGRGKDRCEPIASRTRFGLRLSASTSTQHCGGPDIV